MSDAAWILAPIAAVCVVYVVARAAWQSGNRARCIYCGTRPGQPHEPGCRGQAQW